MPAEQALISQWLVEFLGGVERHLDDALDIPVDRRQCPGLHPEAARYRGSDFILVEDFTLNFAGLENVFRQGFEDGVFSQGKPKRMHAANQPPLPVPDGCQLLG